MKQQTFEKLYKNTWAELEQQLQQAERGGFWRKTPSNGEFPTLYRRVCHHLSLAQQRRYSNHLVTKLNDLVLRSHQQLYRRRSQVLSAILRFIIVTFPSRVREQAKLFWLASAIFYLPGLVLFILVLLQPDLIFNMLDYDNVSDFEAMYDPGAEHIGQDREATSDVQMFGLYIKNNISVGFQTFATGLFFGLGSIFYLTYNGLLFGALAGHMVNIGYIDTFFGFVIAHGSFELTAIVIAGMGGLMLGHALIAPGRMTRLEALSVAGKKALDLLYGIILFLLIAAFLEAFWSSNSATPIGVKYTVGGLLWLLVFVYLAYCGRGADGAKGVAHGPK